MVKLYRTTDRIPVKIDKLHFKIAPLSFEQKAEIQSILIQGTPMSIVRAAKEAIKCSVKEIKGLVDFENNVYELDFEDGKLTDSCVDDLLNVDHDDKLSLVCTSLLNGIPKEFVDPQTGKPIKGISIERQSSEKKK